MMISGRTCPAYRTIYRSNLAHHFLSTRSSQQRETTSLTCSTLCCRWIQINEERQPVLWRTPTLPMPRHPHRRANCPNLSLATRWPVCCSSTNVNGKLPCPSTQVCASSITRPRNAREFFKRLFMCTVS